MKTSLILLKFNSNFIAIADESVEPKNELLIQKQLIFIL